MADEKAKAKAVFDSIDTDKSGSISTKEVVNLFKAGGKSDDEAKELAAVSRLLRNL